MTGYRLKVVEKVGVKLVDVLHKADPWAGEDCGRKLCMICESKKKEGKVNSQDCHRRNIVYQTYCRTCQQRQDTGIEEKFKEEGKKRIDEEKRMAKRFIYIGRATGVDMREVWNTKVT